MSRRSRVLQLTIAAIGTGLTLAPPLTHGQSGTLSISATVLSKSNCKFKSNTALALNFGTIDPTAPGPATATATRDFSCQGSAPVATFAFSDNGGQNFSGGTRRMRHATVTTEFLPYSITLAPDSGTITKNATQTLTVTGTITQAQYQNAYTGSYSDTVILTLSP